METKYKFIIDIAGILISSVSLGLLIANQYYVASGVILIVSVALSFLAYLHFSSKPITQKEVQFEYVIHDSTGQKATAKKIKKLVANERNITLLVDHNISGSGSACNFKTNIGEIASVKEVGGNLSVYTALDVPLEMNKVLEHVVEYEGLNCFTENRESITINVTELFKTTCVKVSFPADRKPSQVRALMHYKSRTLDLSQKYLTKDSSCYSFTIKKPKPGSLMVLEWDW